MAQTTIEKFATDLKMPSGILLEQLAKALPKDKCEPRPREDERDERNLFDRVKDMFG